MTWYRGNQQHHFPMARHFLNKRCLEGVLTGIPIGIKLSIDLLINFPEFQSNDSQQA